MRWLAGILLAVFAFGAAAEEGVIATLSANRVSITADFSGSEIFIAGAVTRDSPAPADSPLDVVITVTGPSEPVTVRRKARQFGVWMNTDSVEVDRAPSFYAVASTRPLDVALSQTLSLAKRIGLEYAVKTVGEAREGLNPADFTEAVIRIRHAKGIYYESPEPVKLVEETLFTANFALPANLVEGDYAAKVYLLRNKQLVDDFETSIAVRKVGLERWIYNLSRQQPFIYGLLSIIVALAAGWGASEVFRVLRR
jgi:uncharacterized protein (TIGR02186 family)